MKKLAISLAACCGVLCVLLVAAILILPSFIDVKTYTPKIEQKIQKLTGRSFTLGEDFNVSLFPWASVSFKNLQLGNPEQFGTGDFTKVGNFEARVKLLPLLFKNIEVNTFELDSLELHLIKSEEGQVNWVFNSEGDEPSKMKDSKPADKASSEEKDFDLTLRSLEAKKIAITNGRILYEDRSTGTTKVIDDINLKLQDVSLEKPIGIQFTAKVDHEPISVSGSLGPIGKNPGKGKILVSLAMSLLDKIDIKLQGDIEDPAGDLSYNLTTDISPFSPKDLMEKLEIGEPLETTDPLVLQNASGQLTIKGSQESFSLSDSKIMLDDSSLIINAEIKEMEKPNISFDLQIDQINIDRYLPPQKETEATPPLVNSTPPVDQQPEQQKIDYTPLRSLTLKGKTQIGELIAHGAIIQNISMNITGSNGVFNLSPCTLDLYKGHLNLEGNLNIQEEKPKTTVEIQAKNIQMGPLLNDTIQKDILEGGVTMEASLGFLGDTPGGIKKTLNGKGNLDFLDGALVGIDIADMARNFAEGLGFQRPKEKPRTDFAELRVPFTIQNSIFNTAAATMQSPLMRLKVDGNVDLVQEILNLNLNPKIVGTLKGQGDTQQRGGLSIPIKVEGTFSEPKFSANMKALVTKDALTEAAKNPKTQQKAKELGEKGASSLDRFGLDALR